MLAEAGDAGRDARPSSGDAFDAQPSTDVLHALPHEVEPESSPPLTPPVRRLEPAAIIPDGDAGRLPPPPDAHVDAPRVRVPSNVEERLPRDLTYACADRGRELVGPETVRQAECDARTGEVVEQPADVARDAARHVGRDALVQRLAQLTNRGDRVLANDGGESAVLVALERSAESVNREDDRGERLAEGVVQVAREPALARLRGRAEMCLRRETRDLAQRDDVGHQELSGHVAGDEQAAAIGSELQEDPCEARDSRVGGGTPASGGIPRHIGDEDRR